MIAREHVYVTKDRSRVVEETDPDVGMLLYAAGDDIPEAEAKRLGLGEYAKKAAKAQPEVVYSTVPGAGKPEEGAPEAKPAEAKAVAAAETEDKAVNPPKSSAKG